MSGRARARCPLLLPLALLPLLELGCASSHREPEVGRLEKRMRELEDRVYLLQRTQEELADRLHRLDGLGASATGSFTRPGEVAVRGQDEADQRGAAGGQEPVVAVADDRRRSPAPSPSADAGRGWQRAESAFDAGRYPEAIAELREFTRRYPADTRANRAQFLLGEAYYARANFPQAIVEYGKLVEAHPSDAHAPEALYKVGLSYYELGYRDNAREQLERLVRAYPSSRAAEAAKPLLGRLRAG